MTTTISLKQTVYWIFHVLVDLWDEVLTRWSPSLTKCCVPSRSGSWSPSSVFPSATAWCRSLPRAARPIRGSRRPSGSRVSVQKQRTRALGKQWVCSLPLANVARTCRTSSPGAWIVSSAAGAEKHRVEVVGVLAACCILTPDLWASTRDVSRVALRSLSWACFPSSSWIYFSTASSSSCTECSSNMSSPELKGRHKSAIKASNSETMVNVWIG